MVTSIRTTRPSCGRSGGQTQSYHASPVALRKIGRTMFQQVLEMRKASVLLYQLCVPRLLARLFNAAQDSGLRFSWWLEHGPAETFESDRTRSTARSHTRQLRLHLLSHYDRRSQESCHNHSDQRRG